MDWYRRRSLTWQLSVILVLLTTGVLAIFGTYRYIQDSSSLHQQMNDSLQRSTEDLARGLSSPFFTYYEEGTTDIIQSAMQDETLVGVFVFDIEAEKPRYGFIRDNDKLIAAQEMIVPDQAVYESREIFYKNEVLGTVYVVMTNQFMQARLRAAVTSTIVQIIVLDLVLVILVISFIRVQFVRPIIQLTEVTSTIADGDIEKSVDVVASGEIDELARSFAKMRGSIRQQIVILEEENTERKKAEAALRESEGRLQAILDNTTTLISLKDLDGRYLMINQRFKELFDVQELKDETDEDIFATDIADMLIKHDQEVIEYGQPMEFEEQIPQADGLHTYISVKFPLRHVDGEAYGVCSISTDITERERAERERYELERQMTQTQKLESLGVLAGGIAHDFNNLLLAVMGNTEMALDKLVPGEALHRDLSEILEATSRAADLANQMLAYAGQGSFVVEAVDLSTAVDDMVTLLHAAKSKNVDLKLDLAQGLPPVVVDISQLRQVIMNLVINASESIGENAGTVTVTTGMKFCDEGFFADTYLNDGLPTGNYVFFDVVDTGCGMSSETKARAFDPFYTTKFTGRGLGLAALLGIVRGHRGAIRLDSEEGLGTHVTVVLPVSEDSVQPAKSADIISDDWQGTGTVLLVEDEEPVRNIAEQMLERLGFDVITANDGIEALAAYKQHGEQIRLVLLDMTMPNMNGEETLSEIRQVDDSAIVILCSGYTEEKLANILVEGGPTSFIQKPYRLAALGRAIREALTG